VLTARLRSKATDDVEQAVEHYGSEADVEVATRFVDDLERTIRQLEAHPELGSLRLAFDLDLPGLRSIRAEAFPYLVFYLIRGEHLDVLRVLHPSRDVPAMLRDS
jgi:toxin ParE1/3/4